MDIQTEHTAAPPMVSIVMPSYNCARFIKQSIGSIQAQTYKDWELIVVDDCSTDNSVAIIESIITGDNRVHLIRLQQNSSAAIARNTALRAAKGKYIAFLDSDDTWSEDKLQKQISFMEENGYTFTYTAYWRDSDKTHITGPKCVSRRMMETFCWIGCSTVMYNRQCIGPVQITPLRMNNDYAMWLQICQKADCYLLDEELTQYYSRKGSISHVSVWVKLKWHYRLWRQERHCSRTAACYHTFINSVASIYKKVRYMKKA